MNKIITQRILKEYGVSSHTTCYSWWDDGSLTVCITTYTQDGYALMSPHREVSERPDPNDETKFYQPKKVTHE